MFNIDLPYKRATPMKLDGITKVWFKKIFSFFSSIVLRRGGVRREKLLHPPSCTLDAVKVFKAPLQGSR